MQVIVNGKDMEIAEESTFLELFKVLSLDPKVVIAEHNGEIVPRESFPSRCLEAGDQVELVRLVGGG